jgi:hypothetical protein
MKIQALAIAVALAAGGAFAAAPNDTAKAPADTSMTSAGTDTSAKPQKKMKAAKKHHAAKHAAKEHKSNMSSASATDMNDRSRQARMDDALAKYRQQRQG